MIKDLSSKQLDILRTLVIIEKSKAESSPSQGEYTRDLKNLLYILRG